MEYLIASSKSPILAIFISSNNWGDGLPLSFFNEYSQKKGLISVAGGGDTFAAIKKSNQQKHFTYISTAGGAFLEWLEGKMLPGLKVLENK